MALPGPSVSASWLEDNLASVQLADVRWSILAGPARAAFIEGHIPGAVFVDLDADLSGPPGSAGRHPLPSPGQFAAARRRLGLGDGPIVAYDDVGGSIAGRLWWMLDAVGVPAAVLDGGINQWQGRLEIGEAKPVPVEVDERPWPSDRFISADDVLGAIASGSTLLDARSEERFRGEPNPIDPVAGHIPGARSRPWTRNLGDDGTLLPVDELREQFTASGVGDGADVIASCGSGVTGCHLLWAASVAGLKPGRLYTGSWSEWIGSGERPIERSVDD